MKYIRRVTALVLAIIFCAAIVIGLGIIYSVKNVNVEFVDYSGEYIAEYEKTKENLNRLKGSGLLFLSYEDVESKLSDSGVIALESYERNYPCTVNVRLKERVECFVVRSGEAFSVYDEDGKFMRTVRSESGIYLNALDESPDVEVLTGDGNKLSEEQYVCVAELCKEIKYSFSSLRKYVKSVTVYDSLNTAKISFRSGLSAVVPDWRNDAKSKVAAAYSEYLNLSDKQRTCGSITVSPGDNGGEVTAKYGEV